jgi:lysophospholipase L1-like esterase
MLPRVQQRIAEQRPIQIVLFGDSISEVGRSPKWNGGASEPVANWGSQLVQLLASEYPHSIFSVAHFAIGGQNTYEGLGRLDALAPFNPDLVLLQFGTNDCCFHYLLPDETKLALTTMATEIRNRFDADVVIMSTGGDNPLKATFRHLDETISAQCQAAAEANVPFLDMRAAILAATEYGRQWSDFHLSADNCHPNDKGHQVWAQAAFAAICEALR